MSLLKACFACLPFYCSCVNARAAFFVLWSCWVCHLTCMPPASLFCDFWPRLIFLMTLCGNYLRAVLKVHSVEGNLYSILFGSLGCYQLRIGWMEIYIYIFLFHIVGVNSGCKTTWGLGWGSKLWGQIFIFPSIQAPNLSQSRFFWNYLFLRSF